MKTFVKFVGMAPFWGLTKIRPAFFEYQTTTRLERRKAYARFMIFLIILVGLHGAFAHMGIRALRFNAPIFAKVIFAFYAMINVVVSTVQICLMFRATYFFRKDIYPRVKRRFLEYTVADEMKMIIITLPVQILVVELFLRYMPAGH